MSHCPLIVPCLFAALAFGTAGGLTPAEGGAAQAVAGPAAVAAPSSPRAEDPFPLRRLRVNEAQFPEAQKLLEPGPLARLSRDEFESRVRAAGAAVAESRQVARVTDARFKATLVGGDLVGTGEWDVVNPGAAPRLLSLDPLRLALGPATWADGRPGVLGVPSGGTVPALWVDRPGRQTLRFGWSATSITEPGERRFELRVPTSPTAVLELELPVGLVPAVPPDVLLTGPFPAAGTPTRVRWSMRFGGRSRLDVAVRPAGNPGVTAAAVLSAKYDISPGQLACGFEYDLRPASGTVGEWVFTIDPGLRVTDVVVNNRAGWVVDPPAEPGQPRRLRVTLRQPGTGGKVLVSAVAPFPDRPSDGPLPAVRPATAVLTDETLELRLAPSLKVEGWRPGDYRLLDTQAAGDQARTLTLTSTLSAPGSDLSFRRLPTVVASISEQEFTTAERVVWRLDADRATASVRLTLRVRRGLVFGFSLKVPPGYRLTRSAAVPESVPIDVGVAGDLATVELNRPLVAGQSADFQFEFRGPALAPARHRLPFPSFTPVGSAERAGVLGVYAGSAWNVDLRAGAGTSRGGWFDLSGPSIPVGATGVFRYGGSDLDGSAELAPARPEFTVDVRTRTDRGPERGAAVTTFGVNVRAGTLPLLVAWEHGRGAAHRSWRVSGGNAVAASGCVPVELILRRCVPTVPLCPGSLWVVALARPASGELDLEAVATSPEDTAPMIVGAVLTRAAAPPDTRPSTPPTLKGRWEFSGVHQVTAVCSPADVTVVFGGSVSAAMGAALPITLPAGVDVQSATVAGKWLEPGDVRVGGNGVLNLPLPSQLPARFEVRYRVRVESAGPVSTVRSPSPGLPGDVEVRRWWAFAPGTLPGWPAHPWEYGAPAQLPALQGGPPISGPGVLAVQSASDEMRFATSGTADAAGAATAAVLLLLAWFATARRHPFLTLAVTVGLLAAAAATQLAPPWWQRAATVPLAVGLIATAVLVVVRGHRSRVPGAVALVVFACAVSVSGTRAQPPGPVTVLLLPPGANGSETVAVPKAVLDRLAGLSKASAPGVIITTAEYAVTEDDTAARVVAKFTAHALPGGDLTATLPLSDARLEWVAVNGAVAFPTVPRPGAYAVPLPGPGAHEIEVRFAVAVTGTGSERDVRFGVPEVPSSKVTVDLPGGSKQSQVVGRLGRQATAQGNRLRLEADLGAAKSVHVRRRDGAGGAAAVKVREGCVWDVSEDGAELTAAYLVRVEQGTVSSLRFDVPTELEPLSLVVRSLDPGGAAALRDWTLGNEQGGHRPLRLDLQEPTAGRVLVVLTLAPRKALTRQPLLRFPRVAIAGTTGTEPDAAYGIRTRGATIDDVGRAGAIDFSPDALTREFSAVPELRLEPGTPVRVFRPTASGATELRPTIRVNSEQPGFTIDTRWSLGLQRGVGTGTVRWSGKDAIPLLEFQLPGVAVTEVRGPEVAGWAQPGGRVQVWLKRSAKEGEITWSGRANVAAPFEAQTPRVVDGRTVSDTVRVRPAEGLSLRVERDRGWTLAATANEPLAYRTTSPAFPPVRVGVSASPEQLHSSDLGWFGTPPRTRPTPPELGPTGAPPGVPTSASPVTSTPPGGEPTTDWVWPASVAIGWGTSLVLLAVLMVRFPHSMWPEQVALVGVLFGAAVAPGWWLGPAVWLVARLVWFFEAAVQLIPLPRR